MCASERERERESSILRNLKVFCHDKFCCCCHFDIDVCIYSTCAFLIVKWILMLIMYSATSM